jgi:hypothetical protein
MSIAIFAFGYACGGLSVIASAVWFLMRDTPRACAFEGCNTNHWNTEKFCSHHILDEYEEHHGRGSRPG